MQRVAGKLRANQVRERQRHLFRRGETVLAVENHAVAAVEQEHGGARTLVFGLVHHQIGIIEFDGNLGTLAAHRVEQGRADVEIERVAKFIGARDAARFDAGGQIARVVTTEAAFSQRRHQVLQRLEAEKVDRLVGDFKSRLGIARRGPAQPVRAASFPAGLSPAADR